VIAVTSTAGPLCAAKHSVHIRTPVSFTVKDESDNRQGAASGLRGISRSGRPECTAAQRLARS